MFDFVNYTYSGVLSILSCLFGMSYPLVIGCIEKIDSRFHSTKLTERFLRESSFKMFKLMLVINLISAVVSPFFMDGNTHSRIILGVQCSLAVLMVVYAFLLFSRIISYYNVERLHELIIKDYNHAVNYGNKDVEALCFTEWVDITPELLFSADDKLAQKVYEVLADYIAWKYQERKEKECEYDQYFYDGISRINETLCKGDRKPISINNGNSILTSLIFQDSGVSETSYRYLWRNLRTQLYYGKDEWIMEYWKIASQKYGLFMKEITPYSIKEKTGKHYSLEELETNKRIRDEFQEFHIMLCAMLLQSEKYDLVNLMLSFTQSEPPSYPLVPSDLRKIIFWFNRINGYNWNNPFYLESKYQMPYMHGITDGKIAGAANCYLALLVYRLYIIRWTYGYERILATGTLPNSLSELASLKQNIEMLERWLEKIKNNEDLLETVFFTTIEDATDNKVQQGYTGFMDPKSIIRNIVTSIDEAMEKLRRQQPLDDEMVNQEEVKVHENLIRVMQPYRIFMEKRFDQDICYHLNSSVTMPFSNTAFLRNPDIGHAGIAECMVEHMQHHFRHMFASSFFSEHSVEDYIISSDSLFPAIDRLRLNESHIIVSFGIYLDYFLDRITGLKKDSDYEFNYKGTHIISLPCPTEYFSQIMYIIRKDDCPYMKFGEPKESDLNALKLKKFDGKLGLWMSIIQISNNPEVLQEPLKSQLGDSADKHSLFTCIWAPRLYFKPKPYEIISIKVKYRLTDEGSFGSIDDISSFDKYAEGA